VNTLGIRDQERKKESFWIWWISGVWHYQWNGSKPLILIGVYYGSIDHNGDDRLWIDYIDYGGIDHNADR